MPVYTDRQNNPRRFSRDPIVGEDNYVVTGQGIRFVDAADGYSYSYSEAGSTLLGRTDVLNARAAGMMPDATQLLVSSIGQPLGDAIDGMTTGAGNFGKGALNAVTDSLTGGHFRNFLGYDNPLALERTPYQNARSAAYGFITEGAFTAWTAAAGGGAAGAGARSSTLSVVPESQAAQVSSLVRFYPENNGFLGATQRTFLNPGDQISRYGSTSGRFFSPSGTPLSMRSLPPNANTSIYNNYTVLKPFEVREKQGSGLQ